MKMDKLFILIKELEEQLNNYEQKIGNKKEEQKENINFVNAYESKVEKLENKEKVLNFKKNTIEIKKSNKLKKIRDIIFCINSIIILLSAIILSLVVEPMIIPIILASILTITQTLFTINKIRDYLEDKKFIKNNDLEGINQKIVNIKKEKDIFTNLIKARNKVIENLGCNIDLLEGEKAILIEKINELKEYRLSTINEYVDKVYYVEEYLNKKYDNKIIENTKKLIKTKKKES